MLHQELMEKTRTNTAKWELRVNQVSAMALKACHLRNLHTVVPKGTIIQNTSETSLSKDPS